MSREIWIKALSSIIAAVALTTMIASPSFGSVFNLKADVTTMTMPDGNVITMWGFGLDGGSATIPGPMLIVPPGDKKHLIRI